MPDVLKCSFCHTPEGSAGKLIASAGDLPRAYICDECVLVCASILEDDAQEGQRIGHPTTRDEEYLLLGHPQAPDLLRAVFGWVKRGESAQDLTRVRDIARSIMGGPGNPSL